MMLDAIDLSLPQTLPQSPPVIAAIVAGSIVLLIAVLFMLLRGRRQPRYETVDSLLTAPEQAFLPCLRAALGTDQVWFAKVRIVDVLRPRTSLRRRRRRNAWNEIVARRFDFVICAADDLRPLIVVELDNGGPRDGARRRRDRLIDSACAEAGLPMLRIASAENHDSDKLRHEIEQRLAPPAPAVASGWVTADGRREPILDLPDDPPEADRGAPREPQR